MYVQIISEPCKNSPCLNMATCASVGDTYYCECLFSYWGSNCEKRKLCLEKERENVPKNVQKVIQKGGKNEEKTFK